MKAKDHSQKIVLELVDISEEAIEEAFLENQNLFANYFIDYTAPDDARYTYVSGSLEIENISIDGQSVGVDVAFQIDYFEGCKDRNSVDLYYLFLELELIKGDLVFEFESPKRWGSGCD